MQENGWGVPWNTPGTPHPSSMFISEAPRFLKKIALRRVKTASLQDPAKLVRVRVHAPKFSANGPNTVSKDYWE
ncbi:hypothetical protein SAMN05421878_1073 [Actinobaculum suis]|uniref:Uncharacterized protein n=1 Tax=Actinobaculum suis TaxID=1657 RepID=A0A1G7CAG2_9ACTO|nr:hypothetical protein SAMN05421878_1073 [Actinobaculum suis]